ncbi:MAG: hypothetical protein AAGC53_03670 [Actinomycetota bacterium]
MATACLTFDPAQKMPGAGEDIAATCFRFMVDHQETWVHRRPQVGELSAAVLQGGRAVLYGETGAGKTTIIGSLAAELAGGQGDHHVAIFDFNLAAAELNACESDEIDERLRQFVLTGLEQGLERRTYYKEILSERDWEVAEQSTEFATFRALFHREIGKPYRKVSRKKREEKIRSGEGRLLAERQAATEAFDRSGAGNRLTALVRAIAGTRTLALCFDNVDPLTGAVRDSIGRLAQELANTTKDRVGVAVACRSEHRSAMQSALDTGTVQLIPVDSLSAGALEEPDAWDINGILRLRIALLAENSSLVQTAADSLPGAQRLGFVEAVGEIREQFNVIIAELSEQSEPDRRNERLIRSLVRWTNEDIRSTVVTLAALVDRESDISGLLLQNRQTIRDRMVHSFYRHLATGEPGSHGQVLRPSLDFFVAKNADQSSNDLPFFFLRFRVLSHIHHLRSDSDLTVQAVVDVFQASFGVGRTETRRALNWLSQRDGMNSGYVRFETATGRTTQLRDPGLDADTIIKLLPAGRYFCDRLVSKVEYLFWLAVDVLEIEPVAPNRDIRGRGTSASERVMGACRLMDEYLLPRFLREHPYMDLNAGVEPRDQDRIARFKDAFGFTKDNWFIERLAKSIKSYADGSDVEQALYSDMVARVETYAGKLNFVESFDVRRSGN